MNIVNSLMKDLLISGGWSESCVQMYQHDYVKPNIIETYIQENKRVTGVKITKQELKNFGACQEGFKRFIIQTNNTDEPVEVISLIGGENFRDCLKQAKKAGWVLKNAIQFVLHQVTRILNYDPKRCGDS